MGEDRFEKIARAVLWLSMSMVCASVLLVAWGQYAASAAQADAAPKLAALQSQLADALKPKDRVVTRFTVKALGAHMMGLRNDATGKFWFTNVSPRSGVLCIAGVATDPDTREKTSSLPRCATVDAYASFEVEVVFASAVLSRMCKQSPCKLEVVDIPDATETTESVAIP